MNKYEYEKVRENKIYMRLIQLFGTKIYFDLYIPLLSRKYVQNIFRLYSFLRKYIS